MLQSRAVSAFAVGVEGWFRELTKDCVRILDAARQCDRPTTREVQSHRAIVTHLPASLSVPAFQAVA